MRLSKDVGNTHYTYLYQNGLLVQETIGDKVLDYSYTSGGQIVSVRYKTNAADPGVYYYYALNSRGDVVGLYDENGALYAKYTYDVWGNPISVKNASGANLPSDDIANIQSLRYRGYYYDSDTGFYYLQSRYYDPVTHRFINADSQINSGSTILSHNLFAYCENNPVIRSDIDGHFWKQIGNWLKKIGNAIKKYLTPSNTYGSTVGGVSIASASLTVAVTRSIRRTPRPNNIGAGIYAKQCAREIQSISKYSGGASKALSVAGYGVAAIDIAIGIHDNIANGASTKKIVLDATVDAAISGVSIWAAGAAGSAIGASLGTIFPGAGNLIGAAAGFVIGIGIYAVTDMVEYNGKTARTWAKEGVNSLW